MDSLLEASDTGERKWIYPWIRKGTYYKWRSRLSYAYLILFFTGPFLRIKGQPFLLFNVIDRQFVLLGQVFWPQDIFLFMLASLVFVICIVLFTIAFGRIFCGWICPQTIFMEMVFRKVEIWIEGDANKRKKLDAAPWNKDKIAKKTFKHMLFLIISFLIANTFLAYIIGSENLLKIITQPINMHWVGFFSIWLFTLVFYLVYSRVRELVCTVICPYGRLQGVLMDENTLVVAYNEGRGEPRGKLDRTGVSLKGDCVDCNLCVAVCPTGIDIRNGTQMECTNCTACIDACDEVMDKIHKPRNLVGYFSETMIHKQEKPSFNIRMKGYSCVIMALLVILGYFIFNRSDMDITVMRGAGMLYQQQPNGYISNIYNADITNKTNNSRSITLKAEDHEIHLRYIQAPGNVSKGSDVKTVFFILIPGYKIRSLKTNVRLQLISGNKLIQTVTTTFIGPLNN
ncbi:MAG: cytochrome c oxidase accessory protein FixG [Mucilaginibacter sp.]|nr:cytochrome c oxidase accessory protein FixG [Mucilaginibacter sp.]